MRGQGWTDERVQEIIGRLLQIGVIVSAALVLAGGVYFLIRYGAALPDYHAFRGEPADLRSPAGIVSDAVHLRSRGLIQFGLLLLIATPVARVAFSVFAFLKQGDRLYVAVTLIVLSLLVYSLAFSS